MSAKPTTQPQNGYSIMEVLVSVFILALVVGILGAMFYVLLRSYVLYSTRDELLTEASRMTDTMADTVRSAYGIEATRVVESVTYTSTADTVIVKLAGLDQSGNPIANVYDYIIFTRDGADPTLLRYITDADPLSARQDQNHVIGHDLSDLVFLYKSGVPATSTDVYGSVTVTKPAVRVEPTITLHFDAKLRNK